MNLPELREITTATNPKFLAMLVEQACEQFGFKPDDQILKVELEGLPEVIPLKFKFKKEKEAEVIIHSDGKE